MKFSIFSIMTSTRSYILDVYTGANAAFSLRKLRRDAPLCFRIRRSSDNQEVDIGFLPDGKADIASASSFVGSDSGFITIWYDQSGNNLHATNSTAGRQPVLISSGSLNTLNGQPALLMNQSGTTCYLDTPVSTGWTDGTSGEWQGFTVASWPGYATRCLWIVDDGGGNRILWYSGSEASALQAIAWNDAGTNFNERYLTPPAINTQLLLTTVRTATTVEAFYNTASDGSTATTGTPRVSPSAISRIGAYATLGFGHQGNIQELICFPNSTDNRAAISDNINRHYAIY
jgi:hypothetical protein